MVIIVAYHDSGNEKNDDISKDTSVSGNKKNKSRNIIRNIQIFRIIYIYVYIYNLLF